MKENGKVWLMAIVMGMILPGLFLSVAEKVVKRPDSTQQTDNTTGQTESASFRTDIFIPVLHNERYEQVELNTYLTGVLLGEMPTEFDPEALKAQAVVARTYTLKRNTTGLKHQGGAVCTDATCCQAYCSMEDFLASGGTEQELNKVKTAVHTTNQEVLTYQGALIEATYFSCSGGKTEDALAVWGAEIPYLQAVDSPGEENATFYTDKVTFSAKNFASRLGFVPQTPPVAWLGQTTYTRGGGVDTIVIDGKSYKGTDLRQKLGLRSTAFTVQIVGDSIQITTRGFGHRVGMSQYGAEAMAVQGSTYREILMHYYPGTEIVHYLQN